MLKYILIIYYILDIFSLLFSSISTPILAWLYSHLLFSPTTTTTTPLAPLFLFFVAGVAQGLITGIRGLCNGLGPALFGLIFFLFHVDLNEIPSDEKSITNIVVHNNSSPQPTQSLLHHIREVWFTFDYYHHCLTTDSTPYMFVLVACFSTLFSLFWGGKYER